MLKKIIDTNGEIAGYTVDNKKTESKKCNIKDCKHYKSCGNYMCPRYN